MFSKNKLKIIFKNTPRKVVLKFERIKIWLRSKLKITTEPLLHQPALYFWTLLTGIVPAIIAVLMLSDRSFLPTSDGAEEFARLMQPVIPWIGLVIAVAALIARAHATVQTHARLELDNASFSMHGYFTHRKYIWDSFERFESDTIEINPGAINSLYMKLFPSNSSKQFSPVATQYFAGRDVVSKLEELLRTSFREAALHNQRESDEAWDFDYSVLLGGVQVGSRFAGFGVTQYVKDMKHFFDKGQQPHGDQQLYEASECIQDYVRFLAFLRFLGELPESDILNGLMSKIWTIKGHNGKVKRKLLADMILT